MDYSSPGFLSIVFSTPEYRSGLPFPSPEHRPNSGIKPMSPALQADSSPIEPPGEPFCILAGLKYDYCFSLFLLVTSHATSMLCI